MQQILFGEAVEEKADASFWLGDVAEVCRALPENHFHGCLCDPPYGLTGGKKGGSGESSLNLNSPAGRSRITTGGFMGMKWDAGVPGPELWCEVLRVLKPGAFLLAFGGTRTYHRLACAIEDAGFELRDCMMWLYGSGFPKSLDISKAIDKAAGTEREVVEYDRYRDGKKRAEQSKGKSIFDGRNGNTTSLPATDAAKTWYGYGTALKPSWEPILVAMKPCEGTFAENAVLHGVAGLNIEAGRIELDGDYKCAANGRPSQTGLGDNYDPAKANQPSLVGRWPANLLLDEEAAAALDEQTGELTSGPNPARRYSPKTRNTFGEFPGQEECVVHRGADRGGASRFFCCAKASREERGEGNVHPTVKPLKLTEYLARLILPPGNSRLLVPFSGSGSEVIGARRAGWKEVVGIEAEPQYVEIARKRLRSK